MKDFVLEFDSAIDMLPAVGRIYEKLEIKDYVIKQRLKNKGKSNEEQKKALGMDAIFVYVFKNIRKVKAEVIEVVSIAMQKPEEEVKHMSFFKVIKIFKTILEDKELTDFFGQAVQ